VGLDSAVFALKRDRENKNYIMGKRANRSSAESRRLTQMHSECAVRTLCLQPSICGNRYSSADETDQKEARTVWCGLEVRGGRPDGP